jgi:chaperonin GroEL
MKQIDFNTKESILEAVKIISDAVGSTLGAGGRNVLLQVDGGYAITKDGVTVAKDMSLEDSAQNAVAQIVKDAALRTARDAGDGTTTSTVLVREIIENVFKNENFESLNVTSIRRGIEDAASDIIEEMEKTKKSVETDEQIKSIASISGNNDDKIGNMMLEVYKAVGKQGAVRIEETQQDETTVDVVNGCQIESGYINANFSTNAKKIMEYDDALVFITDKKFEGSMEEMIPILEPVVKTGKPFVVICGGMEGEPLGSMIANKVTNGFKIGAIQAPYFGSERVDILEDLAAMTGAKFISEHKGHNLSEITIDDWGSVDKIYADENYTTIIGRHGSKEDIEKRVEYIEHQKKEDTGGTMSWRYKQRLAALTAGVGVVRVGGKSEAEMKDMYYRIEDALSATRAALNSGYVIGGGMSYFYASNKLKYKTKSDGYSVGYNAMLDAAKSPVKWIVSNAGDDFETIEQTLNKLRGGVRGYNAVKCEIENMEEAGIIDPLKVVVSCVSNASSVASMLITTNTIITNKKIKR